MDRRNLEDIHRELNEIYKKLVKIHDELKMSLDPLDFINIGNYTREGKGAIFTALAELHKLIEKEDNS